MRRREFIAALGGAAIGWPLTVRAQQPITPVIGFLSSLTPSDQTRIMAAFSQGLNEVGFAEGRNVAIEYRWAEGQYERLPALAVDLVRRQVAVIAAISGTPTVLAAKAATATIPIVFAVGGDPVAFGFVASLNRPGGNITGATFLNPSLGEKRLEVLRELVPKATTITLLVNPANPVSVAEGANVQAAAHAIGQQVNVLHVSSGSDLETAFATLARERPDALFVSADPLFFNERIRLAAMAARYVIPAIYADHEIVEAGGLIGYGPGRTDAYRLAGVYVGRILKGEKAADLPVQQSTKVELVLNLKTAKALGLTVPPTLLGRADEVIE